MVSQFHFKETQEEKTYGSFLISVILTKFILKEGDNEIIEVSFSFMFI